MPTDLIMMIMLLVTFLLFVFAAIVKYHLTILKDKIDALHIHIINNPPVYNDPPKQDPK